MVGAHRKVPGHMEFNKNSSLGLDVARVIQGDGPPIMDFHGTSAFTGLLFRNLNEVTIIQKPCCL